MCLIYMLSTFKYILSTCPDLWYNWLIDDIQTHKKHDFGSPSPCLLIILAFTHTLTSLRHFHDKVHLMCIKLVVSIFQAIINSTISPNMTFTKTSQKFGQWADSRANTVYGLGFSTEHHLAKVTHTRTHTLFVTVCDNEVRKSPAFRLYSEILSILVTCTP